jgi:aryl-alcohol dehydrogenase-like predicted oxidoreductase
VCADEGIGTIVWSPLARGRLARESEAATGRSGTDPFADMLYTQESSDRAIIV